MLHWPQGRVAGLHVCKKGMQHSLTVACTCVIDNSCLIAYACVNGSGRFCICKWTDNIAYVKVKIVTENGVCMLSTSPSVLKIYFPIHVLKRFSSVSDPPNGCFVYQPSY